MTSTADKKYSVFRAAIMLCGTILGVGIFALPKVVADAGYLIGFFWMIPLAFVVALQHILYGEIVAATKDDHRLVGYVGMYLGPWARVVETIGSLIGLIGGNIAYLVLSGIFLQQALSPAFSLSQQFGAYIMAAFGAAAAIFGTAFILRVDTWMACLEFAAFLALTIKAMSGVSPANFAGVDTAKFFLPYGVVLFSYGGLSAVNEVKAITAGNIKSMRKAILIGSLMASGVTFLFVTAVVGATGKNTSSESIAGLATRFDGTVPIFGALVGFLAIITTYVVFTDYLKNQLNKDYRWPKWLSVLIAAGAPLTLYLFGVRNFGRIMELIGSVLIGVEGIFVVLMYRIVRKKNPEHVFKVPAWALWVLIAMYAAGALYEIVFRLFR